MITRDMTSVASPNDCDYYTIFKIINDLFSIDCKLCNLKIFENIIKIIEILEIEKFIGRLINIIDIF